MPPREPIEPLTTWVGPHDEELIVVGTDPTWVRVLGDPDGHLRERSMFLDCHTLLRDRAATRIELRARAAALDAEVKGVWRFSPATPAGALQAVERALTIKEHAGALRLLADLWTGDELLEHSAEMASQMSEENIAAWRERLLYAAAVDREHDVSERRCAWPDCACARDVLPGHGHCRPAREEGTR